MMRGGDHRHRVVRDVAPDGAIAYAAAVAPLGQWSHASFHTRTHQITSSRAIARSAGWSPG